jgi:hypothetical protein
MAQTKLPPWLEKLIMQSQGPGAPTQAPMLSGVGIAPKLSHFQPLVPMMPTMAPLAAPKPISYPDAPMMQGQVQQLQQNPTRQRPMMPELRTGPYEFPDTPTMPTMPDAPIRNVSAENRAQGKEALKAGLIGLLLGGGEGAMAAVTGTRQGMQGRANQDMSERERQFMVQMQRAQREAQGLQQDYSNRVGQVKAQMGADDDFNQRQLDLWKGENTLYNNEENRELKDEIAARSNELGMTKAQNQFMLGLLGMGPKTTIADAAKMRAGGYVDDVKGRNKDREADNNRADDKLDFDKLVGMYKLGQGDQKIAMTGAHQDWMQTNGTIKTGIQQERLKLAQATANAKATGQPLAFTPAQQRALEKNLAVANVEIEKVRNGAGQKPDPVKHPDDYKLWQSRRLAAEESAAALRGYYNDQAALIGMQFDGVKYKGVSGEEMDAKRSGKGASDLQGSAVNLRGKITSYGYQTKYGAPRNDETPDSNSFNLIGNRNNRLRPGSFALSPDMAAKAGLKPGQKAMIRTSDGNIAYGYWDDTTSSALTGRVDFASPGGISPLEGKKVVSITPVKEGQPTPPPTATPYRWGSAPATPQPSRTPASKATPAPAKAPQKPLVGSKLKTKSGRTFIVTG